MDETERLGTLRALQAGRDALGDAIAGVDDGLARRKPSREQWSILECVEHMVDSERYLLTRLRAAMEIDQPFEKSRREAKIAALAADRTRQIEAPEKAHPRGHFQSLAEAVTAFDEIRADVVLWVENCTGDPRRMMTDHPMIEGPVTCMETLVMIAAHPGRHAKQIAEIRAHLGHDLEH